MGKNLTLEAIYALYANDLYRYVYSLCRNRPMAEDIMQETFYRAYFYTETFSDEKIKPWLFKVAYHTFIDFYRKESKLTSIDPTTSNQAVRSSEEEYMVKNQIDQWLRLLEKLPLQQKNVLLLRDYHQFSYDEIAHMLNLTLANVKVLLFRGRKIIHEQMRKEEEFQ